MQVWKRVLGGGLLVIGLSASACAPQSEECIQFIECQVHYEEALSLPSTETNRFKADGVCWESEELAQACTDECVAKITTHVIDLDEADEELGPCDGLVSLPDAG